LKNKKTKTYIIEIKLIDIESKKELQIFGQSFRFMGTITKASKIFSGIKYLIKDFLK